MVTVRFADDSVHVKLLEINKRTSSYYMMEYLQMSDNYMTVRFENGFDSAYVVKECAKQKRYGAFCLVRR